MMHAKNMFYSMAETANGATTSTHMTRPSDR